jgi:alkylation response protein AidB-like acyl-CoA dehydrogenase
MIDFDFTEDQRILRDVARNMLRSQCPMTLVRRIMDIKEGYSRELWSKIAEAGWLGLIIPNEFSGVGLTSLELAIILDEMERVVLQGPYIETAAIAPTLIMAAGTIEQKQRFLPEIAKGKLVVSCGLTEEIETLQSDKTTFSLSGVFSRKNQGHSEGYVLSGTKSLVPYAKHSDYIVLPFLAKGSVLFGLVDSKSEGITFSEDTPLDPTVRLSRISFDKVMVPKENVFRVSDPLALLNDLVSLEAICTSAACVGGASKVLEMTVSYSKSREQFGVPIGSFQAVKHKCADMYLLLSSGEAAAYYAAWCYSHRGRQEAEVSASVAKSYCSEMYSRIAGQGIQIHGGVGFTWQHDLHLFLKRSKRYEFSFGSPSWHRERIARRVIDVAPDDSSSVSPESRRIAPRVIARGSGTGDSFHYE